jgi:hypothetical protein
MEKTQHKDKQRLVHTSLEHSDQDDNFRLERYKFILEEIHSLNENIHKYLALYQTLATAIIGGGIGIFVSWRSLKIDAEIAKMAIQGALGLLIMLTLFIITSILATIFSWFDYRKEEVRLLDMVLKPNFRQLPMLRNFWRWSETYVLIFIVVVVIIVFFYIEYQVIPLIR